MSRHCCYDGCANEATVHVQGYHAGIPDYDNATDACDAHVESMREHFGGDDPLRPPTVHVHAFGEVRA